MLAGSRVFESPNFDMFGTKFPRLDGEQVRFLFPRRIVTQLHFPLAVPTFAFFPATAGESWTCKSDETGKTGCLLVRGLPGRPARVMGCNRTQYVAINGCVHEIDYDWDYFLHIFLATAFSRRASSLWLRKATDDAVSLLVAGQRGCELSGGQR